MASDASRNVTLMRRFITDVQQDGNVDILHEFLDPQMVDHTGHAHAPTGIEGGRAALRLLHDSIENITVTIEHCISDGDVVATHKIVRGTLVKDFMGTTGQRQTIQFRIMDWVKVVEGRFKEHWAVVGAIEQIRGSLPDGLEVGKLSGKTS